MQKVTRHALEPSGATFKSRDSDFVVSDSLDFHPTDVLEDADGSLLVVDTGAWYKLCCPTSQLAKPEVLGAIYRVRRRGAAAIADPRGRAIDWSALDASALAARLDDARPAVQRRAIEALASRPQDAVRVLGSLLTSGRSVVQRRNAVWALTRMPGDEARAAARVALADRDAGVRQAALHSAGLWRDAGATRPVIDALESPLPAVRRGAAEALGRIGDRSAVPALLAASALPLDRIGEHSITYALIEIADPEATTAGLRASSVRTRRTALIAMDQMPGSPLEASQVLPLLDSPDAILKDTAWWIAGHHADWGAALTTYFEPRLAARLSGEQREALVRKLAQFGASGAIQSMLAATAAPSSPPAARALALQAMTLTRVKELPAGWAGAAGRTRSPAAIRPSPRWQWRPRERPRRRNQRKAS